MGYSRSWGGRDRFSWGRVVKGATWLGLADGKRPACLYLMSGSSLRVGQIVGGRGMVGAEGRHIHQQKGNTPECDPAGHTRQCFLLAIIPYEPCL